MSVSVKSMLASTDGQVRLLEAHDDSSVETIRQVVGHDGQNFHSMWMSGLTQTTYLGIPDAELVSPLQRASLASGLNDDSLHMEVRSLCAAYDADSGGNVNEIPVLLELLASKGVSMIVIEDKSVGEAGGKVNSLKETSDMQGQANMYDFARLIRAFTSASAHTDMMITARIESFTVRTESKDKVEDKASIQSALCDAIARAKLYKAAGADAIMIHCKSPRPDEVMSFLTRYRSIDTIMPLMVAPTTYSGATENGLYQAGANIIMYANHLMRAKIYAIGQFSDQTLARTPHLFLQDAELGACLGARNFGCFLLKLSTRDIDEEAKQYRAVAEDRAAENMSHAVKCLLDGKTSSAADECVISVKELLSINAQHVTLIEEVTKCQKK